MAITMKKWSVKKSKKEMTEEKARIEAQEKLETFEGNLKANHTTTHYVFSKIRG